MAMMNLSQFPSPTGVNYYEFDKFDNFYIYLSEMSFRPQQVLTIMNKLLWLF